MEMPSWLQYLEGLSFLFPGQDVDSRDRRRRELGQSEPQEPPEKLEPSTSWWPVSSAERKKNITLVRRHVYGAAMVVCMCDKETITGVENVRQLGCHGGQPDKVRRPRSEGVQLSGTESACEVTPQPPVPTLGSAR